MIDTDALGRALCTILRSAINQSTLPSGGKTFAPAPHDYARIGLLAMWPDIDGDYGYITVTTRLGLILGRYTKIDPRDLRGLLRDADRFGGFHVLADTAEAILALAERVGIQPEESWPPPPFSDEERERILDVLGTLSDAAELGGR